MKKKILDVVVDCMNKGIDSKAVINKLRSEKNLIELPKSKSSFLSNDNSLQKEPNWEKLESEYYNNKFNNDY